MIPLHPQYGPRRAVRAGRRGRGGTEGKTARRGPVMGARGGLSPPEKKKGNVSGYGARPPKAQNKRMDVSGYGGTAPMPPGRGMIPLHPQYGPRRAVRAGRRGCGGTEGKTARRGPVTGARGGLSPPEKNLCHGGPGESPGKKILCTHQKEKVMGGGGKGGGVIRLRRRRRHSRPRM